MYLGFKEQGWGERKFSNELIKLFSEVSERLSSRELYSEAVGYAVLALDTAECAFTLEDGYERFDPEPLMKEIMKGLKALRKKLGFRKGIVDSRVMEELVSYSERSARIAKVLMGYIESTVTGERELMNISGQCSYLLKRKLSEPGRDVVLRMKTDTSLRLNDSSIYDSFMAGYGDEVAVEDQAIWRLMKMKEWKRALEMIELLEKNPMNQGFGRIAWTDQKIECARMMGDHDLTINLIMDEIRKTRGQERKYLDKLLSNASRDELPVLALETMDSCPGFEGKLEIAKALGDPDIFVSLFMDEAVSRKSVTSLDALYRLSLYGNMCKGADENRLRSLYVSLLDDAVQEARNSGHYSTVAKSLCVLYHLGVEGRDKALSYASWIRENLSERKGLIDQVKKYGLL